MYRQNRTSTIVERNRDLAQIDFSKVIAITNRHLCQTGSKVPGEDGEDFAPFLQQVRRICSLHPRAIILREKDLPLKDYMSLAARVLEICRDSQVPCTLHFYPQAAQKLGQTAIHLPLWQLEENAPYVREHFTTIGVSTHSLEEALKAQGLGATYLTAGHLYPTACKKDLPPRGLSYLKEVCSTVGLPIYGLGGIHLNPTQIQEVLDQGAAGTCIMSALMSV